MSQDDYNVRLDEGAEEITVTPGWIEGAWKFADKFEAIGCKVERTEASFTAHPPPLLSEKSINFHLLVMEVLALGKPAEEPKEPFISRSL